MDIIWIISLNELIKVREGPPSSQQPGVRSVYGQVCACVCVYSASAFIVKWVCLCSLPMDTVFTHL